MPIPKKYSFFNLPTEYGKEDYSEATSAIIKKYSKIKDLLSIYSWGDVSVFGISDIDLVFVFKSNAGPLPFLSRSFNFLDARARYIARHPFVFIDEDSFKNIRYVYPDANFRLLHGKNISISSLSAKDKYCSTVALLNDIIIRHYPRDFAMQFAGKRINVRDTLLRLSSLKYSVKMIEDIGKNKNPAWNKSLDSIKKFRENWFKNSDYDELCMLNENALGITMGIIQEFKEFLAENDFVKIKNSNDIFYNGIKNKTLFIEDWSKKEAFDKMIGIAGSAKFYSILPIELAAQLAEYSKFKGLISDYIRKNISKGMECSLKHKEVIERRINILNKQAILAFRLKHSDFAAYFDFGYRNSSGVNNWILGLLDKMRF